MTNPVESFVLSLARASKRGTWHLRGLHGPNRDDVIATALAWCWEHRAKYDPSYTLEEWFDMALRDARRRLYKQGSKQKQDPMMSAQEFNEMMSKHLPDPVAQAAEAKSAVEELMRLLTPDERAQVPGIVNGTGEPTPSLKRKLTKLKYLMPDSFERQKVLRTVARESDSLTKDKKPVRIDRELAKLSLPPRGTKDCPPCFRCMWFYAYMPIRYKRKVTTPADAEVQKAIWDTEERKIDIAKRLRAGTLEFTGVNAK